MQRLQIHPVNPQRRLIVQAAREAGALALELRGGLDGLGLQGDHVGHGVHHRPEHGAAHVEDDDHGEIGVFGLRAVQLEAQIDDGDDDATQVDHALDEVRRMGQARGLLVGADFLHAQDVDAVLFLPQAEGQVLRSVARGGIAGGRTLGGGRQHGNS